MKHILYGKNMFVADLIIVTFWAFFNIFTLSWGEWLTIIYVVMRMALCFQMKRHSPWTLFSAIAFLFCSAGWLFSPKAFYATKRVILLIQSLTGTGSSIIDGPAMETDHSFMIRVVIFGFILNLWIVGLPIVVGILQRNFKAINWNHKWVFVYLGLSACLCIPVFIDKPAVGAFIFGTLSGLLPVIYWTLYKREGRSIFNLLCTDRALGLYVFFLVSLSLCFFIGIDQILYIKGIALLIMPVIFYALICQINRVKPLTRHAVALSVCGFLYYFIFSAPERIKIITISISLVLGLYVAFGTARKKKDFITGVLLFLMPTVVVAPLTLGMNPYVALEVDSVSNFNDGVSNHNGFYVIEKNGKCGVRDRYGVVLPPVYDELERLDLWGRYVNTKINNDGGAASNRNGVFDLFKREFILDPEEVAVVRMVQTGKSSYNLFSPDETQFATLQLEGFHTDTEEFFPASCIVPYHAPAELRLNEDFELSELVKNPEDRQYNENISSYSLLDKARVAVNRKYNEIIKQDPVYRNVYDRWSDLMESMSAYLVNETYGEPYYSMQPLQFNRDIRQWYEFFLPEVEIDKKILLEDLPYTASTKPGVNSANIESFFYLFRPKKGGYNRMWNDIKPAFSEWVLAREEYAEKLDPHKRLSYDEHTAYLTDYIFTEIRGMIPSRNDNQKFDMP